MIDILGYRSKLGLVVPSCNTVTIADAFQVSLTGVTVHVSDILEAQDSSAVDRHLPARRQLDDQEIARAFARMATRSTHSTAVMLDEDFFDSRKDWVAALVAKSGLSAAITPARALESALQRTGIKRAAVMCPFSADDSSQAVLRIEAMGCTVVRKIDLDLPSQVACAGITFLALRKHFEGLIGLDIDAIIQLGHNLPLGRLVSNLEEDFGKPVLAINHVCMWHMLRGLGIDDVVPGVGRLLLDY